MAHIDKARWQVISPLLDQLLDSNPGERAALLQQVRRDDGPLAGQLEMLLERKTAADRESFLAGTAVPFATSLAGQSVGNYTLDEQIGEGGMGSVWLAHRSDGRYEGQVAVKFLHLALLGHGGAERFQREGSILARLAHPHIARLLDAGVATGGQPYLVLEYVEGEPIDRWCDLHGLNVEARVRLFLDVLAAVEHAHSNLILHRDLKPSNILATAGGKVELLDFGIAKLLDRGALSTDTSDLTQREGRAFTPEYAAPEQLQGGDVTTATDVYALGVLLYVMLVGRHPTTQPEHGPLERMRAAIEVDPARLSDVAAHADTEIAGWRGETPARLARLLRGDLDNIVFKALKKAPAERYATATALAEDLRRYLAHEPVTARPDSFGYRAGKFVRRNRLAVGAALALVLALTAGIVGTTWQAAEARRQRAEALLQRDRTSALLGRNEAIVDFIDMMFTEALPAGQAQVIQQMLDRREGLIDNTFATNPVQQAELLRVLAGYYSILNLPKRHAALIARARELVKNVADPSLQAKLACAHAESLSMLGQSDDAQKLLERWLDAPNVDASVLATCLQTRAMMAQNALDSAAALRYAEAALKKVREAENPPATLEAALLGDVGFAQHLAGKNVEADRSYQLAIERLRSLGRQESLESRRLMLDWGVVKYAMGDYKRGLETYDEAIRVAQRVQGNEPIPAGILANRAFGLDQLGRYQDALAGYESTFEAARRSEFAAVEVYALAGMANVYVAMGDLPRAQRSLDRADGLLQGLPEAHSARIRYLMAQARVEAGRGESDAANQHYTGVIELLSKRNAAHPTLASAYRQRAELALKLGDLEHARSDAEHALDLAQKLQGDVPYSDLTGMALLTLARVQRAAGDDTSARQALQTAEANLVNTLGPEHPDTQQAQRLLAVK